MSGQRIGGRVEEIVAAQKAYREMKAERDRERQHTNNYIRLLHKAEKERDFALKILDEVEGELASCLLAVSSRASAALKRPPTEKQGKEG